jgi:hypothetical protein
MGLTMLVVAAACIFFALSQINRAASVARLYTAAQFIVQTQIDQIQSDSPFIPQSSRIPPELVVTGTPVTTSTNIYVDPATTNAVVTGTLSRSIVDISGTGSMEYAYQATIQLNYTYRNTNYNVVAWTIRGSDQ